MPGYRLNCSASGALPFRSISLWSIVKTFPVRVSVMMFRFRNAFRNALHSVDR